MTIVGIGGTNGSGKDTVGHLLGERYNLLVVSVSDFLREEAGKRGLPIERETLRMISAEWRRQHGLGVLIDKAVEVYSRSGQGFRGVIPIPLRNPGEVARVHELGGIVLWVDADPKIRYTRISARKRSAEDNKTFEEFLTDEAAEMQHSGDEATLNMSYVKEHADLVIINNFDNLELLRKATYNLSSKALSTNLTQK